MKNSAVLNHWRKSVHDSLQKRQKKHAVQVAIRKVWIKKLLLFAKRKLNFAQQFLRRRAHLLDQQQLLLQLKQPSKLKKTLLRLRCAPLQINAKAQLDKKVISNLWQHDLKQSPKRFHALQPLAQKHNHELMLQRVIMQSLKWRLVAPMLVNKALIHNSRELRTHLKLRRKYTLN